MHFASLRRHLLRLVHDDNRMIGGNHVNGAAGSKFIPLGIDDARLLAASILLEGGRERLRIDNHHVDAAVGGEGVQLVDVGTAVNEIPRLLPYCSMK